MGGRKHMETIGIVLLCAVLIVLLEHKFSDLIGVVLLHRHEEQIL